MNLRPEWPTFARKPRARRYLAHPDIARRGDVLGWLLVVAGYEVAVAERVEKN